MALLKVVAEVVAVVLRPPAPLAESGPTGERVALGENVDEPGVFGSGNVAHAVHESRVAHHGLCKVLTVIITRS